MELDCGFTRENQWFRYRAAAIIIENGCVLFAGNARADYLYSVGGAVHMGETAEEAVRREVLEETGVSYEIDRLAFIHENFFEDNSQGFEGLACHEIALYFWMKPRGSQSLSCHGTTQGVPETMHWIPVSALDRYRAFPTFLADRLRHPMPVIEHIVTREMRGPSV